jgi:hypothetical protein
MSARSLLDKFPDDDSSCFAYTRALIEHISYILNEDGASEEVRNVALLAGKAEKWLKIS